MSPADKPVHLVITDKYDGRKVMENVSEKKYLGDLISSDERNIKNIEERTNKSYGNVDKIVSKLQERPFGKHTFKTYRLLRDGLLLGGLLTNSDSWINITERYRTSRKARHHTTKKSSLRNRKPK